MQESYVLGNMNTFMRRLAEHMSSWMGLRLPRISDKWWDELVYNNLSPLQRNLVDSENLTDLSGLDLASLLRVFDRNWHVISNTWFMNGYFYNARPNDRPYYTEFTGIVDYWVYIDEPYI